MGCNRDDGQSLISIVDDDESAREALLGLVRALGFIGVAFASAAAFLRSDDRRRTSCLIVDVQMPGMNGLELYRHLTDSGRPIPTVLITAYPDESVRARALAAGVARYLVKPFQPDDLLDCLHAILAARRAGGRS